MAKKNINQSTKNTRDRVILSGTVVDAPRNVYKVQLTTGQTVTCSISGKIRTNAIKIVEGDEVEVELGLLDLSMGRIIRRKSGRKTFVEDDNG